MPLLSRARGLLLLTAERGVLGLSPRTKVKWSVSHDLVFEGLCVLRSRVWPVLDCSLFALKLCTGTPSYAVLLLLFTRIKRAPVVGARPGRLFLAVTSPCGWCSAVSLVHEWVGEGGSVTYLHAVCTFSVKGT